MLDDLKSLPDKCAVLLQTCCHNPTGLDPTLEEWTAIRDVFVTKKLFPILDTAFLGFKTGSIEQDVFPIRLFYEKKINFAVTNSYARNFGLYGECVGSLHIVTNNITQATNVKANINHLIRIT